MKCPHCERFIDSSDPVFDLPLRNAEDYGGNSYKMMCPHKECKKPICILVSRVVKVSSIVKGTHAVSDVDFP